MSEKIVCRTNECEKAAKKEGFCGWCHKKYKAGKIKYNGELSFEELQKVKKQEKKSNTKEKQQKKKLWLEKKENIKNSIKPTMLKVLQETFPDVRKPQFCKDFDMFICEAECFGRIFIKEKPKKECRDCHLHDNRFDFLQNFIDAQNGREVSDETIK